MTRVVNLHKEVNDNATNAAKRHIWLRRSDEHVYIGRPGIYGNPYRLGSDGNLDTILSKYRNHLIINNIDLEPLRGKVLGCWCKPKRCHGDVILELLGE